MDDIVKLFEPALQHAVSSIVALARTKMDDTTQFEADLQLAVQVDPLLRQQLGNYLFVVVLVLVLTSNTQQRKSRIPFPVYATTTKQRLLLPAVLLPLHPILLLFYYYGYFR